MELGSLDSGSLGYDHPYKPFREACDGAIECPHCYGTKMRLPVGDMLGVLWTIGLIGLRFLDELFVYF